MLEPHYSFSRARARHLPDSMQTLPAFASVQCAALAALGRASARQHRASSRQPAPRRAVTRAHAQSAAAFQLVDEEAPARPAQLRLRSPANPMRVNDTRGSHADEEAALQTEVENAVAVLAEAPDVSAVETVRLFPCTVSRRLQNWIEAARSVWAARAAGKGRVAC